MIRTKMLKAYCMMAAVVMCAYRMTNVGISFFKLANGCSENC